MEKRYIWLACLAALAVAGILVAVSLSGGDAEAETAAPEGLLGVEAVTAELRGVPQAGNVLGDPDAPVEVVEYGDLACPACKAASETTIPALVDEYVRDGRARLVFRPIAFISPSSERGALGAEAAAEQDAMWSLVELLYRNQGDERSDWLSDEFLEEAVRSLGLDVAAWRDAYRSPAVEARFSDRAGEAAADQVRSTPTFIVRGPRGERTIPGAVAASEIGAAITAVGPAR